MTQQNVAFNQLNILKGKLIYYLYDSSYLQSIVECIQVFVFICLINKHFYQFCLNVELRGHNAPEEIAHAYRALANCQVVTTDGYEQ